MYHMAGTDTSAGDTWNDSDTTTGDPIEVIIISSEDRSAARTIGAALAISARETEIAIVNLREAFARVSLDTEIATGRLRKMVRDFKLFDIHPPKNYKFWHFNAEYKPIVLPELKLVAIRKAVFNIRNRLWKRHIKPFRWT